MTQVEKLLSERQFTFTKYPGTKMDGNLLYISWAALHDKFKSDFIANRRQILASFPQRSRQGKKAGHRVTN